MRKALFGSTIAAFCLLGNISLASIIEVNSQAAFSADTTGLTTIDFETPPVTPGAYSELGGGTVYTYFADTSDFYLVNGIVSPFVDGSGSQYLQASGAAAETVTFPSGVTAAGSNLFTYASSALGPETVTVTDSLGSTPFTINAPVGTNSPSGLNFVGFLDTTPGATLTTIVFAAGSSLPAIDNFSFGSSLVVVPEPSSVVLSVFGVLGLWPVTKSRKELRIRAATGDV